MKKTHITSFISLAILALSLSACDGLFSSTIISSSSSSEESSQSSETEETPTEPEDPEDPDNPDEPDNPDPNPDPNPEPDPDPDPDPDPEPECQHEWLLKYDDSYHWYECSLCGESSSPESHILEESTINPTCSDTGSYDTYCTVCDYQSHEELPATGEHIWDSGEVTLAPTCESEGEMTYHCTVCQTGVKTESISPLGHDFSGEYQYDESGHWKECLHGCGTKSEQSCHDTVEGEVKTPASCTEDGERYISCATCSFTGTMVIEATGHTPGGDVEEVAPTCTEDGYRSYKCTVCGEEIEGEVIPALGHDYVSKYDDEYHYEQCSRCNEIINQEAHSYDKSQIVESVSPTCQEDGSNSYKCLGCEYIYVETVEAGEAYHDWQVVSVTEPTCLDQGTTSYKCSICNQEKTEISAEALDHDWATDSQGNYIYTDAGDTHYVACTRCEAKTEVGSHTYPESANSTLVEPTCYQEGSEEYLCIYCNHQDIRSIDPTGNHDWYVSESKAATCGEDGYITYKCQTEGCTETYTQELKATGEHTYELKSNAEGHWQECSVCGDTQEKVSHTPATETVDASCLEDGYTRTYCLECNYEISTEVISAVGSHTYEIKEYVEPSCTQEGYYIYGCVYNDMETVNVTLPMVEHTYTSGAVELDEADQESGHHRVCDVCGQAEEEITEHTYDIEEEVEATCTSPSGTKYTCNDCNYSYIKDDDDETILGHSWDKDNGVTIKEPTCTEKGEIEYTCTRCGDTYSEPIDALGHDYDSGVVTLEPTCVDAGQTTYTCTRCGDSYTLENIEPIGVHTYVDEVIDPTCTEAGYTLYTCSVCGAYYQDNPVSALGHDTNGYGCDYDGHWTGGCSRCHFYDGDAYNEREAFHTWAEYYDEDGNMYCLTCGYTEEIHLDDFNVYYDDNDPDSEAHIWGYSGSYSDVTIPMYADGHKITHIEAGVLCEHKEISYVHIPSTLEYLYSPSWLGEGVFQNDTGITHLNIDSGMHDVGENAFYGCTGLTYINLPTSIEHINAYAFYDCSALHELVCPDSVSWLGDYAFGGNCGQLDQTYGGIVYWTGDESAWNNLMYNSGAYNSNYCFCNSYCSRYNENPTEDQMQKWQWRWVGITPTTWADE